MKLIYIGFLVLVFTFGVNLPIYCKGCNGEYIITGIMFDKESKKPLSNQIFIVNNQKVETDENGKYLIRIPYKTTDKYQNFIKIFIENSRINRRKIEFSFNNEKKTIKNKWRKYGLKYCFKNEVYIMTRNFFW